MAAELNARTHLRPDSMVGAAAAFEGIRGGISLINAPTGCKFYPGWMLDVQDPAGSGLDPTDFCRRFFLGNKGVASTALDGRDYVYGSRRKLEEALRSLDAMAFALIGIVNGPGTALIGDDLADQVRGFGLRTPVVAAESAGFTGSMADGFQEAGVKILAALDLHAQERVPRSVNLIGFGLCQHAWEHDRREISALLRRMGIEVLSTLFAGTSLEEVRKAPAASLNLVLREEYGSKIAAFLQTRFGTPTLDLSVLAPYGYLATEAWMDAVRLHFGIGGPAWSQDQRDLRLYAAKAAERMFTRTGLPRGARFAICADSSMAAPLTQFLHRYLGMEPALIAIYESGPNARDFLGHYLEACELRPRVLDSPDPQALREAIAACAPWVLFGSSFENLILEDCRLERRPAFVGCSFPVWGKFRIAPRPWMGGSGAAALVEEVLNGLQPFTTGSL